MAEEIDYTEVPYLQEILYFLPINPSDEEDINSYINNITNLIAVNYKYEQYQFAYFGVHLLYMTYIYCTAWKISQIIPDRYQDVIVFARPYSGREKDLKIEEANSIFAYSLLPEKDIAKLFKIIYLDKSQIASVRDLVDARNDMAHASGKFNILTEDSYDAKVSNILTSMQNIHRCMTDSIRKWYSEILISFCAGEFDGYYEARDLLIEQMIQSFKLSVNELLICKEMSVSALITAHRGYQEKLKNFKKTVADYCQEMGYI
jgi:hypothetical protein